MCVYPKQIDGSPMGKYPRVCALLPGAFNRRAPQQLPKKWRIECYWSLSQTYITFSFDINFKSIYHSTLDIRFMTKGNNKVTFHFHKLHKSWRKGQPPPSICYYSFPEELELCLVENLEEYLERSKSWRINGKTQLLLSILKPHKAVVSSTISGWLKQTLKKSRYQHKTF